MPCDFDWSGRTDPEDGENATRWHQIVAAPDEAEGIIGALIGFPCDLGIARNKGRIGAKDGSDAIRKALTNLAWHGKDGQIADYGNIGLNPAAEDQLAAAQKNLEARVCRAMTEVGPTLVLGGGHETAVGSFGGLLKSKVSESKEIGIINLDAHFDLRAPGEAGYSSGTPFYQIKQTLQAEGRDFNYLCLGVAETANTRALFDRADSWGVPYMLDKDVRPDTLGSVCRHIDRFMEGCDLLYLSIDLDVLPHWQMPAASAPAAYGVDLAVIEEIIAHITKRRHEGAFDWMLSDVVELNPTYDRDNCGAKVAARLADRIMRGMSRE